MLPCLWSTSLASGREGRGPAAASGLVDRFLPSRGEGSAEHAVSAGVLLHFKSNPRERLYTINQRRNSAVFLSNFDGAAGGARSESGRPVIATAGRLLSRAVVEGVKGLVHAPESIELFSSAVRSG